MQPDEVEEMLYEHAIRTKIRAPLAERLSNLSYNRIVGSGFVAAAALVCSFVMSKSSNPGNVAYGETGQSQLTDNSASKRPVFHQQNSETAPASLAMSPVGG